MGKRNIDYAFKSYVLNNHSDLVIKAKRCSLYDYSINRLNETGEINAVLKKPDKYNMSMYDFMLECYNNGLTKEYKEILKINNASYHRTKRLKERVGSMLVSGDCIFITLTFSDSTLSNTDEKQRRVAVSRYLKQFNCRYVANVDYGSKNHREHYHAIIQSSVIDLSSWRKYGSINVERIRNKDIESDKTKLAKYICKLSNHAIKETTKRSSLIYSR